MSSLHTNVKTEVLAASIREPIQVSDCFRVGADVCTLPLPIFYKLYKHILTDKGLEQFDKDWKSLQEKIVRSSMLKKI